MTESLMILVLSLGFVLFISWTMGLRLERKKRKRRRRSPSGRLVIAVVTFAILLTIVIALSVRWLVNLLEKALT